MMPTTAIAAILVTAIAATVACMAWPKPAPGSKADNVAAAVLALVGFPLGTTLLVQHAWAEIAALTIAAWGGTVGLTKGRETVIWTVAAWSGTAVLVWMTQRQ